MINVLGLFFLFTTCSVFAGTSSKSPPIHHHGSDQQINVRVFHKMEQVDLLAEFTDVGREFQNSGQSIALGGRFRMHRNLKLGLIGQRVYGEWHDEDWIKTNRWTWADTSGRGENHLQLEISPRFILGNFDFMTGVFEGRLRYDYNFYNRYQVLRIRPGQTFFFNHHGREFFQLSLRYEWVKALNFGGHRMTEQWAYVDLLFPLESQLYLGPFYSYGDRTWENPGHFTSSTGETFSVGDLKHSIYGVNFVLYL